MMIKKIVYVGSYAKNSFHEMCDVGFLHISSLVAEKVECYKDKTTFPFIYAKNEKYGFLKNVTLHPIHVIGTETGLKVILSMIHSAMTNLRIYFKANKEDLVFYCYNTIFFLHLVNLLNKIFKKKVLIITHGEMDMLQTTGGSLITKLDRAILKNFFKKNKVSRNLHFLVLGDSLYKNIQSLVSDECFKHIHPIQNTFYMDGDVPTKEPDHNIFKCGTIGSAAQTKGLMDYFKLLRLLSEKGVKYDASIIGTVIGQPLFQKYLNDYNVHIKSGLNKREDYERAISELDFAVFFYPSNTYKLIASGAVLDAICMNKPVLCLKNDYLDYAIKETGHPAMIFDNVEQMALAIQEKSINQLQNQDFSASKMHFSPTVIYKQFEDLIDTVFCTSKA